MLYLLGVSYPHVASPYFKRIVFAYINQVCQVLQVRSGSGISKLEPARFLKDDIENLTSLVQVRSGQVNLIPTLVGALLAVLSEA